MAHNKSFRQNSLRHNKLFLAVASITAFSSFPLPTLGDNLALEEIVVTARKRSENLQDVPVSVNAIGADKLNDAGITRIDDLSAYVPNLTFSESGLGSEMFIRGIGSGYNQGFEQSVGMYVDGVYYGRSQLQRAPFLDLEQVEVLRGPQGVLFGKNSIAGAISMTTARPTQEFESSFDVTYEPELNDRETSLVFSGPVTETLGTRFAFRHKESDGYITNLTLNEDEPNRQEQSIRGIIDWQASDELDVFLKVEQGYFDRKGREIEIINDERNTTEGSPFFGKNYAEILTGLLGQDATALNNSIDGSRSSQGDFNNSETDNLTLNANYQLGENTLTFITGKMGYDYKEQCDCDFTAADVFLLFSDEVFDQFSQEIRFTSPAGETVEYLGGVFYQKSDFVFHDKIEIYPASVIGALTGPDGVDVQTPRTFKQKTDLSAVFGQFTWNFREDMRFNLGARLTTEDKEASRSVVFKNLDPTLPLANLAGTAAVFAQYFKAEEHNIAGDRSTTKFTPAVSIQYDSSEDTMLYTSIAKGFKSGGFDARANTLPDSPVHDGSFEFDDEEAVTYEIGSKSTLFDGVAELNTAVFLTKYDNMQVSIYDGSFGFNVTNAGASTSKGVEFDGRWRLTESFFLSGNLGYLDFEWDEFADGQCYFGQTPDSNGPSGPKCDYAGKTNRYTADWSGNLGINYQHYIKGFLFRATLDSFYTSEYLLTQTLDPKAKQDAYSNFDAMLGLSDTEETWQVSIIAKNLTDEVILTNADATPLAGDNLGTPGNFAVIAPPRTFALNVGAKF